MLHTRIDAERLAQAMMRKGWNYAHATREVRKHLPEDSKFSNVSIWAYATGRSTPRRLSYIEAIEAAFGVLPGGLSAAGEHRPDEEPAGAAHSGDDRSRDASSHERAGDKHSGREPSGNVGAGRPPSDALAGQAAMAYVDGASATCNPAPAATPGATIAFVDAGGGKVRLKIDTTVPWQSALDVFEILRSCGGAGSGASFNGDGRAAAGEGGAALDRSNRLQADPT